MNIFRCRMYMQNLSAVKSLGFLAPRWCWMVL